MDGRDPFGYSADQYLTAIAWAAGAGLIKHLNTMGQLRFARMLIDVMTAGFTGVMMFWFCASLHIEGPTSALMIATGGLMGNRAWSEFENFLRSRLPRGPDSYPAPPAAPPAEATPVPAPTANDNEVTR